MLTCPNCYKEISGQPNVCPHCGYRLSSFSSSQITLSENPKATSELFPNKIIKKAWIAGILAMFGGGLGLHDYYLKDYSKGIKRTIIFIFGILLCVLGFETLGPAICACSGIWGFISLINIWNGSYDYYDGIYLEYHKYDKWLYILAFILSIFIAILADSFSDDSYSPEVIELKQKSLVEYPDVSIQKLITSLIANPKWEAVSTNTINVSGKIEYWGKPATLKIGFKTNSDNMPYVYAMEINKTPQNDFFINGILYRMYDLATTHGIEH